MSSIYSPQLWEEYVSKTEKGFKLKTYPHLDPIFDFVREKIKIQRIVSDSSLNAVAKHSFLPFIKIVKKTPRYRYQEGQNNYNLDTKKRPISFASHFDTYILGFYSFCLNKLYQEYIKVNGFDEVVLAYRSDLNGNCNIQFAKEAFDRIRTLLASQNNCSAITLDIKGYFDHIDHDILKSMWCKLINAKKLPIDQYNIYRSLTKYSYVNYFSFLKHFDINLKKISHKSFNSILDLIPDNLGGSKFKDKLKLLREERLITRNNGKEKTLSTIGIPQGSAISALLSNIYLMDFDQALFEKGKTEGFIYRRYCDDMLIICSTEKVNDLIKFITQMITKDCNLKIQKKKTDIVDFRISSSNKFRGYRRIYDTELESYKETSNNPTNFKNLQYLGFEFSGNRIYIRSGSLSRYFIKLKARIFKSVSMAYSPNSKANHIFKKQIYLRYSNFGKRNFLTYAYNAAKEYYFNSEGVKKLGLNSSNIRNQVSKHISILQNELVKTSSQRAKKKKSDKVLE